MSENKIPYKIYLDESEIPQKWYNLRADMKNRVVYSVRNSLNRNLTTRHPTLKFRRKSEISIKCTAPHRLSVHIVLKRLSALLQKFTINLRATIQAEAIN